MAVVEEALKPDVNGSQWKQRSLERVYVFFMAMHKVPQVTSKTIKIGTDKRIVGIVLDKERLLNLFGPSLFSRPEFFAKYAESGAPVPTSTGIVTDTGIDTGPGTGAGIGTRSRLLISS